jgi:hypothetical protein
VLQTAVGVAVALPFIVQASGIPEALPFVAGSLAVAGLCRCSSPHGCAPSPLSLSGR